MAGYQVVAYLEEEMEKGMEGMGEEEETEETGETGEGMEGEQEEGTEGEAEGEMEVGAEAAGVEVGVVEDVVSVSPCSDGVTIS